MEIALELANRWTIPHLLEGAGKLAQARGDFEKGLKLFGAASLLRERLGLDFTPVDRQAYESSLGAFRQSLGGDAYNQIWNQGRQLLPAAAIQLAYPTLAVDGR